MHTAYWNGLETRAIRGTAVVADSGQFPEYWAKDLVGQRIEIVEIVLDGVNYGGGIAYLDNRDGSGWRKVTEGMGSPGYGHRNVEIEPDSFIISEEDGNLFEQDLEDISDMLVLHEQISNYTEKPYSPNRADRRAASKNARKAAKKARHG